MAKNTVPLFHATNTPVNAPGDVGRLVLALLSNDTVNGKAVLNIGGRGWDFEDGLDRTISQWLGATPASMLRASSNVLREVRICQYTGIRLTVHDRAESGRTDDTQTMYARCSDRISPTAPNFGHKFYQSDQTLKITVLAKYPVPKMVAQPSVSLNIGSS